MSTGQDEIELEDGPSKGRYVLRGPDGAEAELTFTKVGQGQIIIDHTEIPAVLRGRKIGERLVRQAVDTVPDLPEWIAPETMEKRNWPGFARAMRMVHLPESPDQAELWSPARQRLAYDEYLAGQITLQLVRSSMVSAPTRSMYVHPSSPSSPDPYRFQAGQAPVSSAPGTRKVDRVRSARSTRTLVR